MELRFGLLLVLSMSLTEASGQNTEQACQLPEMPEKSPFRVMTYNMQMGLGEYRKFWKSETPPMPSLESVNQTLNQIISMIQKETPDVLILQEVAKDACIAYHIDQIQQLKKAFGNEYCYADTDYWKAPYLYKGQMNGSMGYHLVVLSKYKIIGQRENFLPNGNSAFYEFFSPQEYFYPQRKLFEVDIAVQGGNSLTILNTHFDAHDEGGKMRKEQIEYVSQRIKTLNEENKPYILGGDFNLLPPGVYRHLPQNQQDSNPRQVNMTDIYSNPDLGVVPPYNKTVPQHYEHWTTAYDENLYQLDLILDYLIYPSKHLQVYSPTVHQHYFKLSDHVPVSATFREVAVKKATIPEQ